MRVRGTALGCVCRERAPRRVYRAHSVSGSPGWSLVMCAGETCSAPSPSTCSCPPWPGSVPVLVSDLVRGSLLVLLLSPEFALCVVVSLLVCGASCCVLGPCWLLVRGRQPHTFVCWLRTGSVQAAARTRGQGCSQTGLASPPTVCLDGLVSFLLKDFILFESGVGEGTAQI